MKKILVAALALALMPTLALGANIQKGTEYYVDSVTPLAANATLTGATHDTTVFPIFTQFGCSVNADQSGTLFNEDSINGTTWFTASTAAVVAGTRLDLNVPIRARYHRCRLLNGSTLEGSLRVVSSFTD